jgi:mono/diheme cytochrome c family protein
MPSCLKALRVICVGLLFACAGATSWAADLQDFGLIERGRYLTIAADCAACHTVPGSGKPFAGGRPIETPFGIVVGANITPDRETGIGAWSGQDFISAMKQGIGRGGVHLYPAMPYVYFAKMKDEDILAIRAYLLTVEPVKNAVDTNQLPFPFNIRASLMVWNALYLSDSEWRPVPGKSEEWNRGAYLVEGAMHCGACHTPKSTLGGDLSRRVFQGFSIQGWHAPNITNDKRLGIGGWPVEEITQYLKTGHNAVAAATGPMAEEVELSSSKISADDLKAIAVYLKDQGTQSSGPGSTVDASDPIMKAGQAIFADQCAACHQSDGRGVPGLFPALRTAPSVEASDPLSMIRVIIDGAKSASTDGAPTGPGMPSYAWQLNDAQVAAVLTYVRNTWGHSAGAVSESTVQSARAALMQRAD